MLARTQALKPPPRDLRRGPLTALVLGLFAWTACAAPLETANQDPEPSGSKALRAYKEAHYRAVGTRVVAELDYEDVLAEALGTGLLFLGDHHRDPWLHAVHLRLVKELLARDIEFTLAVECVGLQDQPFLDSYLSGSLELETLRRFVRTRWPDSWLDLDDEIDTSYYRGLLQLAREYSIPVQALEPAPRLPLDVRDGVIAANVNRLRQAQPDRLLVVVVGHAHLLGEGHVLERCDTKGTVVLARASNDLAAAVDRLPTDAHFVRTELGMLLPMKSPFDAGQ